MGIEEHNTFLGGVELFLSFYGSEHNHDTNYAKPKDKSRSVHVPIMKGNQEIIEDES